MEANDQNANKARVDDSPEKNKTKQNKKKKVHKQMRLWVHLWKFNTSLLHDIDYVNHFLHHLHPGFAL